MNIFTFLYSATSQILSGLVCFLTACLHFQSLCDHTRNYSQVYYELYQGVIALTELAKHCFIFLKHFTFLISSKSFKKLGIYNTQDSYCDHINR